MIDCSGFPGSRSFAGACAVAVMTVAILSTGCATAFNPDVIRSEIARQTGQDPREVFELSLGRPTMALAKTVLGTSASVGSLPLGGVATFEMATYELSGGAAETDFTRMPIRGWEPAVKFREGSTSTLVLVHTEGEAIGDLVLVAGSAGRVLYARIRGRLSRDLPEALGRTVRSDGPDRVRKELLSILN